MTDWHTDALDLLDKYVPRTSEDPTEPILRALVAHAPTKRGQQNLCQDILKCGGTTTTEEIDLSERLYDLGQYYVSALLVPMLRGGKTSWDTRIHLSKETNLVPTISPLLIEQAKHDLEKTQVLALVRDNYRCVISGVPDLLACETHLVQDPDAPEIAFTTAARILPLSFAGGGESASVWTALSKFSGMDVASELSGHNINRLGNIFTVTIRDHWPFSGLHACLEAVEGKEHTYRVARCLPGIKLPVGKEITFTSTHPELELPDPRFIAIHAACAKTIWSSGTFRYLDRIVQDWEELPVLAEDGSSHVLFHALHSITPRMIISE
ncbi:unnamed protein product [Rhizoctonia solani]|uniref:HNH nuclease domain-containing protein n=2 Tax=Rhizoctonia solani TaxID=456999 RepID=A0A8H3DH81_9AGAM|nr:hypothetical protein V565_162500 [Rhizoctonia solani 123E]CAE6522998.1 unnamed protein product [Rhizoctonia solani]